MEQLGIEIVPQLRLLNQMFANAAAPAFFLGAVAGFVSLMTSRLASINERIRATRQAGERDGLPVPRARHIYLLRQRARLMHDGILLTLCSGICAALLLSVLFFSQFFRLNYAFGSGLLFMIATLCLAAALFRFAQEAWFARDELDSE